MIRRLSLLVVACLLMSACHQSYQSPAYFDNLPKTSIYEVSPGYQSRHGAGSVYNVRQIR